VAQRRTKARHRLNSVRAALHITNGEMGSVAYYPVDVVSELDRRFGLSVLATGQVKGRRFDGLLVCVAAPPAARGAAGSENLRAPRSGRAVESATDDGGDGRWPHVVAVAASTAWLQLLVREEDGRG